MQYYKDLQYKDYYLKYDIDNDEWWYRFADDVWLLADPVEEEYIIRDVENHMIVPISDKEAFIEVL